TNIVLYLRFHYTGTTIKRILYLFYCHKVIHLAYHPDNRRRSFYFHGVIDFTQPQRFNRPLLAFASVDDAFDLGNSDLCHDDYPLNTLFKSTPRCCATVYASRIFSKASIVALTTLCGLDDPNDFASTSVTPALSSTARIAPPANTPVPCTAGLINTLTPEYLPYCSCGTVPLMIGTLIRFFFASS